MKTPNQSPPSGLSRKEIKATAQMKKIMAGHFYELDKAMKSGHPKIAWCTSVGPAELLRAMGFLVYFPENHGAMLGATRISTDFIPVANSIGYSPEICSYLTSDVGAYLKKQTPLSKAYPGIDSIPRPDVLVYNTNQCRDVQDWFAFYSREFKAPLIGIQTHRGVGEVTSAHIRSVAEQMKSLIPNLEKVSGKRYDEKEMRLVLSLSKECSILWKKVLETAAALPSPLSFFDGTIHMGPAVVMRGTQEAVDYYKLLLAELEERARNKESAVEGERFRLYWDGMPIWGKLRPLSELFSTLKTSVVASTYCNSWIFDAFSAEGGSASGGNLDPFNSMARAYIELFIVRSDERKEKYIEEMITKFKIDGIIFHDSKSCSNNTNSRYGMPQRLQERLGIPYIVISGDLNDLRCYSEEQTRTAIEAFVEQLGSRRPYPPDVTSGGR
ncbi:MAG: 2-hydroxyacyl-CoA dehydratase family protein [Planctomycetota bacterium]|nr:2-hydroxyacyl-CoA dehydratase family protein [Planctomycetota bacterium]MDI6786755.1 2-hydroxyacyl-CoA dehydratase family protein [Planctomycetota bacterium]